MDLVELLSRVKDYTEKFGGHELAAGVTVKREKIALFAEQLLLEARRMTRQEAKTGEEKKPDMVLSALDLSLPFAKAVELLEPFGEGNPVPLFLIKDVQIESVVPLSLGKHTKLLVKKAELFFTALLFSQKTALFPYVEGDTVDLVFELSVNEYLKKQSVQLLVRRIIPAGETLKSLLKSKEETEKLLNNESVAVTPPEREQFARVYTALRQYEKSGQNAFSLRILSLKAGCASLAQCLLILLIFEEQSLLLLERETGGEDCFRFRLLPTEKKADLERSELLKRFTKLP